MPVTIDDLSNMSEFGGGGERRGQVTFLPEPEPREVFCPVISTDDHIVEPPHMWEGRFPSKYADLAPRVVETDDGGQRWLWDGEFAGQIGLRWQAGTDALPAKIGPALIDAFSGMTLAFAVASALFYRERMGKGQYLELAMRDCAIQLLENHLVEASLTKRNPKRPGNQDASIAPFGIYRAKDGPIALAAGNDLQWARLADFLDIQAT